MTEILKSEQLIPFALRQNVSLSEAEAAMLLGYMEGHDYVLLADDQGQMVRHDLQMGNDHSKDDPYTIEDAVCFAAEMNEDILRDTESKWETDEGYLSGLRRDDRMLTALLERLHQNTYG